MVVTGFESTKRANSSLLGLKYINKKGSIKSTISGQICKKPEKKQHREATVPGRLQQAKSTTGTTTTAEV
jgi:hypothetical protein